MKNTIIFIAIVVLVGLLFWLGTDIPAEEPTDVEVTTTYTKTTIDKTTTYVFVPGTTEEEVQKFHKQVGGKVVIDGELKYIIVE